MSTSPSSRRRLAARLHLDLVAWAVMFQLALTALIAQPRRRDERGDVPGWVLVTIMSAGLVAVIWKAAQSQLTDMLSSALASVK